MLVMATDASKRLRVKVRELGRYAEYGEKFNVSEDRYKILNGNNRYNAVFVIKVDEPVLVVKEEPKVEPKVEEPVVEEVPVEKPKKKKTTTTKKKTTKKKEQLTLDE